ncbi:hypothetical protein AYO45_00215 [Gammaproteobacteria bacterium SCGC AG-212-F23]|nr:hypothetical protein AYO45_00215 [Gammaproteobacteria bacterium SCGC AG-212-F23]
MLRKTAIILGMLSFSTLAWGEGFYLGAGVGPDFANFKQSSSVIMPGSFNVKNTTQMAGTGIFGTLFGGYGWRQQQFYLAGEANIDTSSVESQASNDEFVHSSFSKTSYTIPNRFGLSVLPGYLLAQATLFYLRLAYANANFKISTTDTSLADVSKRLSGFRYGLGVNQEVSQHFAVRMEYSAIRYQNTTFTTFDKLSSVTKKTTITPESGQVEFGLVYNFG